MVPLIEQGVGGIRGPGATKELEPSRTHGHIIKLKQTRGGRDLRVGTDYALGTPLCVDSRSTIQTRRHQIEKDTKKGEGRTKQLSRDKGETNKKTTSKNIESTQAYLVWGARIPLIQSIYETGARAKLRERRGHFKSNNKKPPYACTCRPTFATPTAHESQHAPHKQIP